jgi:5-formyltetrahydrofolate cyclo-ligase
MKNKKEWRAHYMQQRNALTIEEKSQRSKLIMEHYFKLFQIELPDVVHLFLSMPAKGEVDTRFILQKINEEYPKVKTLTSVISEDKGSLLTIEVRKDTPLILNSWGIPEPTQRIVFPEKEIQEVLTPLLAVDTSGYRLGYGKGFYDRFFESCSSTVRRTGLNFFPEQKEDLPHDEWDVKVHRLISPDGVTNF